MNSGHGQALDLRLGLTKPEDVGFALRWGIIGCGRSCSIQSCSEISQISAWLLFVCVFHCCCTD